MIEGYMLRQDPTTGLYERVEIGLNAVDPPELEPVDKNTPGPTPIKSVKVTKPEKKK